MRVGLTGGTGFIGQYLIRDYCKDFDFVVPIRDMKHVNERMMNLGARFIESDYSADNLSMIFKNCDAVIHLAAKGMPKNSNPLNMSDYISNAVISANVFEACKNNGIKNIVFSSSGAVCGGRRKKISHGLVEFIDENVDTRPDNEYGESKVCSESIAAFYNDVYGMQIKCYRMAEVCGYDLSRGMLNPFWKVLLNSSIEKKPIPIFGQGIGKRDLVYVKDVTRAMVEGICSNADCGTYNIGGGVLSSNIEIAKTFCDVFNNDHGIELHSEKEEWGTNVCLNVNKAKEILKFEARYDLLMIVKDIKSEYTRMMENG